MIAVCNNGFNGLVMVFGHACDNVCVYLYYGWDDGLLVSIQTANDLLSSVQVTHWPSTRGACADWELLTYLPRWAHNILILVVIFSSEVR